MAHFAAVLTVVASAGSPEFPPPPLAVEANRWVLPYVRLAHLTSAYRFFARNPGPVDLLWFRVRSRSGRVRWVEWPDPEARWRGLPHRRDMATGLALRSHLGPPAPGTRWPSLDPLGQACVASFARYLARTGAAQAGEPVASVEAYLVAHRILLPYEVQMGWRYTDLRLYQPIIPLGIYDGAGRLAVSPVADDTPSIFARRVIEDDVHTGAARADGRWAIPQPIRELLARFPLLASPGVNGDALRGEIERLVLAGDAPERIRDPARRAYEIGLRSRADRSR